MRKKAPKSTAQTKNSAKLRIIAGEWRSRQLPIPNLEGLRPTPDRVRETLFNWIQHRVPGANCADVFCGSGALGLEALSRGAKSVVFVDTAKQVSQQMKANLSTLGANNAQVIQQSALEYLMTPPEHPMDIVFLDPPFRKHWLDQIIPLLTPNWLAPNAYVYIEMEKEASLPELPKNWRLNKEKSAGQLVYRLFQVVS
ncbi:16S rRNA (guanine(966)-N(2))-methyltransferase RsmD [Marinomonas epiphytica]